MPDLPARQDFWNIGYPSPGAWIYILLLVAACAIAYGLYRRYRLWRLGKPSPDMGPWSARLRRACKEFSLDLLGHRRFLRGELYGGLMHLLLFWGATVLLLGTALDAVEFNWHFYLASRLGFDFPTTPFRLQTGLVWDVAGLMTGVGAGMAIWRRYIIKPERLDSVLDDGVVLSLIAGLVVTGFALEGFRLGASQLNASSPLYAPREAWFSPVGYLFALTFRGVGMTPYGMEVAHYALWWFHFALVAFAFLYVGARFSKLRHILISPLNVLLRPARAAGALQPMGDLETLERFGARDVDDFTWKQLLDWDACTDCGRCQDRCPAWASGKPLSPRKVMQDLSGHLETLDLRLLGRRGTDDGPPSMPTAYDVVGEEALWACTTCGACNEACPVAVQPVDTIVEMRRYLVMEEARMSQAAQETLLSLEQRGHPWRGTPFGRLDWARGLDVRTLAEHPDTEWLLWVGCTIALEQRSQALARAMVKVLQAADVDFAVLGEEETCTGDPARRLGNEYLFQLLAHRNIETLDRYGVQRIVTLCPHCFNTLKNEYPQLGGNYQVFHYTQLVDRLIREGRLKPAEKGEATVAYHDPCYLGRYNGIYEPPRRIVGAVPGTRLVEMSPHHRREGFCCGAGGGRTWMEERVEQRVSALRIEQFLTMGADTLAVSCPFCLQMLAEGLEAVEAGSGKRVRDVIELLADSLGASDDHLRA